MSTKISANFRMISACQGSQKAKDVNVPKFKRSEPAGIRGGALTSSLLRVLYKSEDKSDDDLSYRDVLRKTKRLLADLKYTQIPQLLSSHSMKIETKFGLSRDGYRNQRALLIGINYKGSKYPLYGCQYDVLNMKKYIMDVHGFPEDNIDLLMDDGIHIDPTKSNIIDAFKKLVELSESGDVVYVHFADHGAYEYDTTGKEVDRYDETIYPIDYSTSGTILDDEILTSLVLCHG